MRSCSAVRRLKVRARDFVGTLGFQFNWSREPQLWLTLVSEARRVKLPVPHRGTASKTQLGARESCHIAYDLRALLGLFVSAESIPVCKLPKCPRVQQIQMRLSKLGPNRCM